MFSKAFFHGKMASFFQKQLFMKMRGDENEAIKYILSTIFKREEEMLRGVEFGIFWMGYYTNGVVVGGSGRRHSVLASIMGETQDFTFCCCYGVFKWENSAKS